MVKYGKYEDDGKGTGIMGCSKGNVSLWKKFIAVVCILVCIAAQGGAQVHHRLFFEAIQNTTCPDGYQKYQQGPGISKCFIFVNMSSSWEESKKVCRSKKGHLASPETLTELFFIHTMCKSSSSNLCWLGAKVLNSSKGISWKWSDCHVHWNITNVTSVSWSCTGLDCDEPCVVMPLNSTGLQAESCTANHPFICVLDKDGECMQVRNRKEYLIILIAVSCLILATTMSIVIWLLLHRRIKKKRRRLARSLSMTPLTPSLRVFTSEELNISTNNFSIDNRLRGNTFKGVLTDGTLVVVKKLEKPNFQGKKEFMSEMRRISRLRHPNLVKLIGCCYDHGQRFLAYEFIYNGPLDLWLHDPVRKTTLDWRKRMRIALTAAQAIGYLHDRVKPQVIHRDIKASSILLDENFEAHLMGVGLANIVPWEAAYERTALAGTHGYLAPEFVYRNELTTKSDVYSFGVLMLELISGRKPAMPVKVVEWQTIFEWATPLVQAQRFLEIIDPSMSSIPVVNEVKKIIDLIYSCTQHVPLMRPRMSYVVHQLQTVDVDAVQEAACSSNSKEVVYPSNEPALISVQSEIIESLF